MLLQDLPSVQTTGVAGTAEPVKCMYWIKEMEMDFKASECDDNHRVKFASHLLKGDALTWWNLTRFHVGGLGQTFLARI